MNNEDALESNIFWIFFSLALWKLWKWCCVTSWMVIRSWVVQKKILLETIDSFVVNSNFQVCSQSTISFLKVCIFIMLKYPVNLADKTPQHNIPKNIRRISIYQY